MALVFVDASGGSLAALAAGVARAMGRTDALAATTRAPAPIAPEVRAVLAEIGATPVTPSNGAPEGARRVELDGWHLALHAASGTPELGDLALERLALARIARDRIARRLELAPAEASP